MDDILNEEPEIKSVTPSDISSISEESEENDDESNSNININKRRFIRRLFYS